MNPVAVIGGGVSGLAAATELTARGLPVLLLEQKPFLGGRAYSFADATTGDTVDNGQHVLVAACTETLRFLDRIGTRHLLDVVSPPTLLFHHPERGLQRLRFPPLPAPLHLAGAILLSGLFSPAERVRILRAGRALWKKPDEGLAPLTVAQWLDGLGQTPEARRSFWDPLAVSVMNEHCDRASALVFIRSLRQTFSGNRAAAALALPAAGLSQLYVDAAAAAIARQGGTIRCSTDVVALEEEDDTVVRVRTRDGAALACSAAVLAVPPYRASALMGKTLKDAGFLADIGNAPSSPIISVHLWFKKDFMPQRFLGIIGRRIQWLFKGAGHLSAVISAAHAYVDSTSEEMTAIALEDLKTVFPGAHEPPFHSLVIKEKRATFSCTPEAELMRPGPKTPLANLFLAGDWTATGLPATIEGAVISGLRAAELTGCWVSRGKA